MIIHLNRKDKLIEVLDNIESVSIQISKDLFVDYSLKKEKENKNDTKKN